MSQYRPWPHIFDLDDEIRAAMPSCYIKYDTRISNRYECEFFIKLNGKEWRKCAELILAKVEERNAKQAY